NGIFSEPPTCPATPYLGAAALAGGALPGGSICGLAGGGRAGGRGRMAFLANPRLPRRPRISGPPRWSAARSLAARSAAWRPAREQEPGRALPALSRTQKHPAYGPLYRAGAG